MRFFLVVSQVFIAGGVIAAIVWTAVAPPAPTPAVFYKALSEATENNAIGTALLVELQSIDSPLTTYYLGARIKDGVATVYFRSGVEQYLYAPPGIQAGYLQPIVSSLQNIPGLIKIQWAIDGKVITDFDA